MAVASEPITLLVKLLTGDIVSVECFADSTLIELKRKIADLDSEFDIGKQRLFLPASDFDGPSIELRGDEKQLSSFGVEADCMLYLFFTSSSIPFECMKFQMHFQSSEDGMKIEPFHQDSSGGCALHLPRDDQFVQWSVCKTPLPTDSISTWAVEIKSESSEGLVRTGIIGDPSSFPGASNNWNCLCDDFYGFASDTSASYVYTKGKHAREKKAAHKSGIPMLLQYDPMQMTLTMYNSPCLIPPIVVSHSPVYLIVGISRAHKVLIRPVTQEESAAFSS